MTGKFTIKRRLAASPRPDGQSSQLSVLQALGIGVGRSSPHTGSKRGYAHLGNMAPELAFARAQEWHLATGRALPPQMRTRPPLEPPEPMGPRQRWYGYAGRALEPPLEQRADVLSSPVAGTLYQRSTESVLDDPALTPAQRRRLLHKAGQHGDRPAGFKPGRPEPGPRAPKSPAAQRRARKNAAQQARHAHHRVSQRAAEILEAQR